MKLKVKMIIMSHLSDVQELQANTHRRLEAVFSCEGNINQQINNRINFAKFLLLKYPDTNIEVDAEEEYKLFTEKHLQA